VHLFTELQVKAPEPLCASVSKAEATG